MHDCWAQQDANKSCPKGHLAGFVGCLEQPGGAGVAHDDRDKTFEWPSGHGTKSRPGRGRRARGRRDRAALEADFKADAGDDGKVTRDEFCNSVFELADQWTSTTDAEEYLSFSTRLPPGLPDDHQEPLRSCARGGAARGRSGRRRRRRRRDRRHARRRRLRDVGRGDGAARVAARSRTSTFSARVTARGPSALFPTTLPLLGNAVVAAPAFMRFLLREAKKRDGLFLFWPGGAAPMCAPVPRAAKAVLGSSRAFPKGED
ncbi:cytochrome p450 [Aureococcus anophagefferens]|nr:cytochrome p450 [Aureococcus anophagefferens]